MSKHDTAQTATDEKPDPSHRPIRSFVLRQGRLTKGQQSAMDTYWSQFGVDESDEPLDFAALFGNDNPVTLEIGFGMGGSLAEMAKAAPERNFLGIEVHTPGVGHLLHLVGEYELQNVRVMNYDAAEIIRKRIPNGSLDCVQLYFPDPWHKKRHNKRRLLQTDFVTRMAELLHDGGTFHMATDWEDYALHMAEVMQAHPAFATTATDGTAFVPRPDFRPLTKFENRGLKLGHGVWDLIYRKV